MKKAICTFLAGLLVAGAFSFKAMYDAKNNTAEVEQYEGIYIFTDSKPVKETDYLGSVKVGMSLGSGQYTEIRDKLIKKAKKEYPTCQGIIIHLKDGDTDKADAIKFK